MTGNSITPSLTAAETGFAVSLCVIALFNLAGNTLVILVIVNNKCAKTPMNYLLLNLAVADIMVGIFIPTRFFPTYFFPHPDGLAGIVICRLFTGGNLAWIGGAASIAFLVTISIERYLAVLHPLLRKAKLNWLKVKSVVTGCWVFAVLFNSPYFFILYYNKNKDFCVERWPKGHIWLPQLYTALWLLLGVVLPSIIMFTLYSRIIYSLWFKHTTRQIQLNLQFALLRSRKRITKMVVTVSLVYFICWTPDRLKYFLHYYGIHDDFVDNSLIIYNILLACNSAINPFIYALRSKCFRKELKIFLFPTKPASHLPKVRYRRSSRQLSQLSAFSSV